MAEQIIQITVHKDLAEKIEERATDLAFLNSEYCRLILTNWIKSGKSLTITEN